jgi:hypothetical protein
MKTYWYEMHHITDINGQRQKIFHMHVFKQSLYLKMLLVLETCIFDVR